MKDPIGAFERIRDLYITYLETAFRIRDENVSRERRALLETPGHLCTEPLLEPIPRYEQVKFFLPELMESTLGESVLPGFGEAERRAFVDVDPEDGERSVRPRQLERMCDTHRRRRPTLRTEPPAALDVGEEIVARESDCEPGGLGLKGHSVCSSPSSAAARITCPSFDSSTPRIARRRSAFK